MIRLDLHTRPFIEQLGPTIPGFIIRVVLKSDVEFVAEGAKWKVHSRTKCHFRVSFEFRAMKKTSADRRAHREFRPCIPSFVETDFRGQSLTIYY